MFDVILISPENTQLGHFKSFVPRSVPIGIGILAGYLRGKGLSIKILDQELVEINTDSLRAYLDQCNQPRIVGVSVMTANVGIGFQIAEMIKSIDKEAVVVFGGIHATVMPNEILLNGSVDFVVRGEAEYQFHELIQQIKKGKIERDKLENISYIEDDQIVYTKTTTRMVDLNEIPSFPYDMFDPSDYNLGFILSSRGCPFDCIFCSQRAITKRRYRYKSPERTIEELDYLINKLNQKNITFFDDYFTGHKQRVLELCAMIIERGLDKKASFGVQTRGDSLDKELLLAMKAANFTSLMFGVETSSERLMELINKKETVAENVAAIKLAKEMGFTVEGTFIFGFPTETFEDRLNALSLVVESGIDRARFNNATPYPGTQFYEMVKDKLTITPNWDNFSSAGAVTSSFRKKYYLPYVPDGCTEKELEGSVLLANLLFYLNLRNLKKLFNFEQDGSGKWFEVSKKDLLSPKILFGLMRLGVSVLLRVFTFLLTCRACRRFFYQGLKISFRSKKS